MSNHSIRTIIYWGLVALVGALQALHGAGVGDFTLVIAIIGFAEHVLNGNTSVN